MIRAVARWARKHLALWMVGAATLDVALITLTTVLIALPGQSGSNVSILILVLLVLSVVFPVAGYIKQKQSRAVKQGRSMTSMAR